MVLRSKGPVSTQLDYLEEGSWQSSNSERLKFLNFNRLRYANIHRNSNILECLYEYELYLALNVYTQLDLTIQNRIVPVNLDI